MTHLSDDLLNKFNAILIAPCGMNCGLCIAHLREKKPCAGCKGDDVNKVKHCVVCQIRNCDEMSSALEHKYCFDCAKFPCVRLRKLDNRYRTKYGMSMIENLEHIRAFGMDSFIDFETERWKCTKCGKAICVHREKCIYCDSDRQSIVPIKQEK